jgi:TonB-dependent receptor
LAFSAEANYGDLEKEWSPTFSGLISNTWDTDHGTFGLLVSANYSRIRNRADGVQVTNYQTRDGREVIAANTASTLVCRNPLPSGADNNTLPAGGSACGTAEGPGADGFADFADARFAPLGPQWRTQNFDRERDGFAVVAQYETLDERTRLTAEFIRSHTRNQWGERSFETGPDLSEYNTYPIGCQQNENGPGGSARAECPVGGFQDYVYDSNGLFQSGYITSPNNGWRGDPNNGAAFTAIGGLQQSLARRQVDQTSTNEDYSLNMFTQLTDRLSIELDAQYATSRRTDLDFSVFGSTFADAELDLTGDLPVGIPHRPQFTGYSWFNNGQGNPNLSGLSDEEYFGNPDVQFWRAAMDHIEDSEGDQYAFEADLSYEFDGDSFIRSAHAGARFSSRESTIRYSTFNWGVLSEVWGANGDVVRFGDTDPAQSESFDFPNFFRGQTNGPPTGLYYSGDLTGDYDGASDFFLSINQEFQNRGGPAGWRPLAQRGGVVEGTPFLPSEIQELDQTDFAAYGMLKFGSDEFLGGNVRFAGNIGLRYVDMERRSIGQINVPDAQSLGVGQTFADRCQPTVQPGNPNPQPNNDALCLNGPEAYALLQQFAGADETVGRNVQDFNKSYWLPSLNLKFGLSDDVILRFAASRVLSNPDNSLVRNFLNVTLDGTSGGLTSQSGNPFLRPATAWTFDASLEWYFAPVGSLTLNGFYKDISGFFFQDVSVINPTNNGITAPVLNRGPANFDGNGKVQGFEIAYQHTWDFLPAPFDGFGVQANYTYIDSSGLPNSSLNGPGGTQSTVPPGNLPLEQLSKHNVNFTGFYEKGPISLRAAYNWRSRFLLTAADVIFPFYSIFNDETGQLDGSIFYSITDDVRIGVQGVNLLNETTKTLQAYTGDPDDLAPRSFFTNDRRFSFILRANF